MLLCYIWTLKGLLVLHRKKTGFVCYTHYTVRWFSIAIKLFVCVCVFVYENKQANERMKERETPFIEEGEGRKKTEGLDDCYG